MSQQQSQDLPIGYMDGVCVKISEKYKPPPRINLAVTYSQRLSLNKQIQNNFETYDFSLERNIKDRIRELRNARRVLYEEKKERLEKIKETRKKFEEENAIKQTKNAETCDKETEVFITNNGVTNVEPTALDTIQTTPILSMQAAPGGIPYPSSYSNILTPTLLTNTNISQALNCNPNDKSPFNISDFEADTSSPFDNMELKTINDIEELAQVLKKDEQYTSPYTLAQVYSNYVPPSTISTHSNISPNFTGQAALTTNTQYSTYNISQSSVASYAQPTPTTMYSNINGYYYNMPDNLPSNEILKPYTYNQFNSDHSTTNVTTQNKFEDSKKMFRSVPDIMKALETELENTHVSKIINHNTVTENHQNELTRPKRLEDKSNEKISKGLEVDGAYELLPKKLQHLSKNISSMGFPLSRVARVCQALGDDHKKVFFLNDIMNVVY